MPEVTYEQLASERLLQPTSVESKLESQKESCSPVSGGDINWAVITQERTSSLAVDDVANAYLAEAASDGWQVVTGESADPSANLGRSIQLIKTVDEISVHATVRAHRPSEAQLTFILVELSTLSWNRKCN